MNHIKNNNTNFVDQIDNSDDSSHANLEQEDDDFSCNVHDNKNCNDKDGCVFNDNIDVICSDKNENNDDSNDENEPENDNKENDNNLESVAENAEGSLEEEENDELNNDNNTNEMENIANQTEEN